MTNQKVSTVLGIIIILIIAVTVGVFVYKFEKDNWRELDKVSEISVSKKERVGNSNKIIPTCEELNIPQDQIDAAVFEAVIGIENPWGDENDFKLLSDRIEAKLGCVLEKTTNNGDDIDTSDWKTYRNEEYGFEFRYPREFTEQNLISKDILLSIRKKEVSSDHIISLSIEKNSYRGIKSGCEDMNIEGRKACVYFFQEGAGYSGVFQVQMGNDLLELIYDVIGGGNKENVVQDEMNKIISTFKFTK